MNASAAFVSPAILALAQAAKDASRAVAGSTLEERNRARRGQAEAQYMLARVFFEVGERVKQ